MESMTADFDWQLHPDAQAVVGRVADALAKVPRFACFAAALGPRTSTRIQDWLDLVGGPVLADELHDVGYVEQAGLWRHPGAQLPAVVITDGYRIDVRVDDA